MAREPAVIVPLAPAHVKDVARLHCATLTGLLSRLGPCAASAYYTGCARSAAAAGFVFLEAGEVKGFVLGSLGPGDLQREVVRHNPVGVFLGVCAGVLRRPSALRWLARSFRGPDAGSYDATAPELTYLAVGVPWRGTGAGRRLVEAFTSALREAGATACELSVDADNAEAVAFYERLGFRPVGRYREFGVLHLRYRLDLLPPGAGAEGAQTQGKGAGDAGV